MSHLLTGASVYLSALLFRKAFENLVLQNYFRTKYNHKFIHLLLNFEYYIFSSLALLQLLPATKPSIWSILPILLVISFFTLLTFLIYLIYSRKKEAVLFLISWSTGVSGFAIWALAHLQLIPKIWILSYAPLYFWPLQLLLLSFIIFDKIGNIYAQAELAGIKEQQANIMRTLFRTLSHDLSNTTHITLLSAETGKDFCENPKAKAAFQRIFKAASSQMDIITNAKQTFLNREKFLINLTPVNLNHCLRTSIDLLDHKISKKNIQIQISDFPEDLMIMAEPISLTHQVFTNLLDNAVKFTPSGKKIKIEVDLKSENVVTLHIADEGIGMPPEIRRNLFEENRNMIRRKGTENEASSGLGLLIVQDFMKYYNAKIDVESNGRIGTRFSLHFQPATTSKI